MRGTLAVLTIAGLAAGASAQLSFDQIARINVDPAFGNESGNGTNPSAVAWDGTNLFVAGFNGGTASGATQAGIVPVSGALTSPSFGTAFGQLAAPGSRGYSGLDISGGTLAAAFDDGASDPNGITAWDTAGNNLWAKSARAGSGVGFDPGFAGGAGGMGVGWTTFGSGRRALQNSATGADIFTTGNGMIINGAGTGTFWRDMDFAPNGDIWLREGNNVISATRTGDNSITGTTLVVDEPEADFVNGQNLAFVNSDAFGNFVVYNDREGTGLGQTFGNVVKFIDASGSALTASFDGEFDPSSGSGYYDFSWDPASQTLAVMDFQNRDVFIFAVPAPGAAALLAMGGVAAARRRR